MSTNFERLVEIGRSLLSYRGQDHVRANSEFIEWDQIVAKWIDVHYPGTGLSAEWSGQSYSSISDDANHVPSIANWQAFRNAVTVRLHWMARVPRIAPTADLDTPSKLPINSDRVFIVHGHSIDLKSEVARFVDKLGLRAIILHEQSNQGRTLIEKFEANADVAFAIVLLTADDKGGKIEMDTDTFQPRARQNVVLELGFFLGKIGRDRVCAICEEGVEIPSDFNGVAYVQFNANGAWKLEVAREIQAAGIPIDMNKAI